MLTNNKVEKKKKVSVRKQGILIMMKEFLQDLQIIGYDIKTLINQNILSKTPIKTVTETEFMISVKTDDYSKVAQLINKNPLLVYVYDSVSEEIVFLAIFYDFKINVVCRLDLLDYTGHVEGVIITLRVYY